MSGRGKGGKGKQLITFDYKLWTKSNSLNLFNLNKIS